MKIYVLMISRVFPAHHPRKGEFTDFIAKIFEGEKKHTIRANYELWKRRAEEINAGRAILSVRQWEDKPYRSRQKEELRVNHICVQKAEFTGFDVVIDGKEYYQFTDTLAKNDGLTEPDFIEWFRNYPKQPMAIIQFTDFKY